MMIFDLDDPTPIWEQSMPSKEMCDRAETIIARAVNCHWITVHDRAQLKANLRIALDTEVEAGGPYLNNGWNATSGHAKGAGS